jgi:toxin ParE1/3/4
VKVEVSEYAARQLEDIMDYLAQEAGARVADGIAGKVIADMEWLADHPRGGQFEPLLDHLGMGHRRLVSGHYKIIYRVIEDVIFISDIFDSRQAPEKMAW